MGLLTQTELIDRARRICLSVPIPVIVDAGTGYGNPLNVHRTVAELITAGAAPRNIYSACRRWYWPNSKRSGLNSNRPWPTDAMASIWSIIYGRSKTESAWSVSRGKSV
jgi:hypothetical protein